MTHDPYGISSPYGPRPGGFHTGDDYLTPVGVLIGAPYAGVTDVRKLTTSYGWHVWVRDGSDEYLMAHLSEILVADGVRVVAGTPIGRTGDSGNTTGPHLHYEWRQGGTARRPTNRRGSLFHPRSAGTAGGGDMTLTVEDLKRIESLIRNEVQRTVQFLTLGAENKSFDSSIDAWINQAKPNTLPNVVKKGDV